MLKILSPLSYRPDELQLSAHKPVEVDKWEAENKICLRSAVKLFNRRSQDVVLCKCKSDCINKRCKCFKKGIICTSLCHQGQKYTRWLVYFRKFTIGLLILE